MMTLGSLLYSWVYTQAKRRTPHAVHMETI